MIKTILLVVATLAVVAALCGGGYYYATAPRDVNDANSAASLVRALDLTRQTGRTSDYGAELLVTSATSHWSAQLYTLQANGSTASILQTWSGQGAVALAAPGNITVTSDPSGAVTATVGSTNYTCPLTVTIDGSSMTYVC